MSGIEGFEEFVAIVEAGSVSAAAREIGVPRPTVSRRLRQLEERFGVRLAHRSTRRFVLTRAGEELYGRARRIVEDARAAVEAIQRLDDVPRGILRVSAPPGGLGSFLNDVFVDYLDQYVEVELEVVSDARHIDLAAEGFDVALRGGTVRDPNLIALRLMRTRMAAVASPDYLDRRGRPESPADLADHECFAGYGGGAKPHRRWPLLDGGDVPVRGRLVGNEMQIHLHAAIRGMGIAMVPSSMAKAAVEEGRLEFVLWESLGRETGLSAVYVDRELLDPKVRTFVDHVAAAFKRVDGDERVVATWVRGGS